MPRPWRWFLAGIAATLLVLALAAAFAAYQMKDRWGWMFREAINRLKGIRR